ncbi:hypothetical protein [Coleofasciculus sp. FACHB-SPT36]|uniref:hypothetical protein n=1 Tax=Cyanophyceae TaxID=3028117 RepID=UPI00168A7CA8|nr:hypothetical protein [Coleofasciculus sp. FACHB-SPT36]MBD2540435.1 hypothetical protein [Coleofasciculus sp. FACHB-SPT36]
MSEKGDLRSCLQCSPENAGERRDRAASTQKNNDPPSGNFLNFWRPEPKAVEIATTTVGRGLPARLLLFM